MSKGSAAKCTFLCNLSYNGILRQVVVAIALYNMLCNGRNALQDKLLYSLKHLCVSQNTIYYTI